MTDDEFCDLPGVEVVKNCEIVTKASPTARKPNGQVVSFLIR